MFQVYVRSNSCVACTPLQYAPPQYRNVLGTCFFQKVGDSAPNPLGQPAVRKLYDRSNHALTSPQYIAA